MIEKCLRILPSERATTSELLTDLSEIRCTELVETKPPRGLLDCKLQHLYHWWQLAGGDVQAELKRQGLIKNSPPILSMPKYVYTCIYKHI